MKKHAAIFTIASLLTLFTCAPSASPQSLVDLANQEKERRQDVKSERLIGDEQLAKFRSESRAEPLADAPPVKPEGEQKSPETVAAEKTAKGGDEPVDFEGRPESYWRQTIGEARQKMQSLDNEAKALALRLNDLQTRFYAEDDGFRREGIQREMGKTFYEQDKNKEDLSKAKTVLEDLLKEARRTGALPGWIE